MTSHRWHRRGLLVRRPRPGPGAVVRFVLAAVLTGWTVTLCAPIGGAGADPARPAGQPEPSLQSAVLAQPLPGFAAVPVGPTNGPLTATEFASQSSNPRQAKQQFATLSAQPGFGAFIRLWTDRDGPGHGANDLVVLVFRIPDVTQSGEFTAGLVAPFEDLHTADPFSVPSVPGARGYSIQVTTPVDATEQVVAFRAGQYVSMIELASTTSATNPTPLTRSQAITVGYQQYQLVRHVDPNGSTSATPVPTAPRSATKHGAPTPVTGAGRSPGLVWPLALAVSICAVAVVALAGVLTIRRRRRGRTPESPADPWSPDGVFASFGAVDPGQVGVVGDPPDPEDGHWPLGTVGTDQPRPARPARPVPSLASVDAPSGPADTVPLADPLPDPVPDPVRS